MKKTTKKSLTPSSHPVLSQVLLSFNTSRNMGSMFLVEDLHTPGHLFSYTEHIHKKQIVWKNGPS